MSSAFFFFSDLGWCVQRRILAGLVLEARGRGSQWEIILGIYWRPGERVRVMGSCLLCSSPTLGATVKTGSRVTDNMVDMQIAYLVIWQMR